MNSFHEIKVLLCDMIYKFEQTQDATASVRIFADAQKQIDRMLQAIDFLDEQMNKETEKEN